MCSDLVMVVTVMVCVGRCLMGAVERRSWLGLGGVGIIIAAGLAAYGLCSGFGETHVDDQRGICPQATAQHLSRTCFLGGTSSSVDRGICLLCSGRASLAIS